MKWDNPLTEINNHAYFEFNFVFKNGQTSEMPMKGQPKKVVQINPPESVVRKISVGYG